MAENYKAHGKVQNKALARGLDSMIPAQTLGAAEPKETPPSPRVHPAVTNAANLIADAKRGMNEKDAETMLRMIIRLWQFHLDNGYLG